MPKGVQFHYRINQSVALRNLGVYPYVLQVIK